MNMNRKGGKKPGFTDKHTHTHTHREHRLPQVFNES